MNIEQARFNMIEQQIRPWNVLDPEVLHLLSVVRREDFCPLAHKALAFADTEIPLPPHSHPSQCMLAPRLEARLVQDLQVQAHETVLEIGTGSGFMAALLAARARQVVSFEMEPALVAMARQNLERAGVRNVSVREGDGVQGAQVLGPFDVIVIAGSVAEIPQALLAQLAIGGRLGAVVGQEPIMQATFVTRTGEATWTTQQPWDTVAPRLQGFVEPKRFRF